MRATATGAGLALMMVLAGCAAATPPVVSYEGDYPYYSSVDELCGDSQLVVLVTPLSSEVREVDVSAPPGDTPIENPSLGAKETATPAPLIIVETITTVRIESVYLGDAKIGSTLEVGQPGGYFEDVSYEADTFELRTGAPFVLFLNVWENDVPASPLNPTQGAYAIDEAGLLISEAGNDAVKSSSVSIDQPICSGEPPK